MAVSMLGRRALMAGAATALAGAPAFAIDGTLVVANWGGDWNERTMRFVEAPFTERTGVRIVHELNMERAAQRFASPRHVASESQTQLGALPNALPGRAPEAF